MIKNAVISTREELMMSNASLYHEFLNNYDVDNSIRVFIGGGGGGGSTSTTKQPIYTERPTCTPIIPTITPSDKPTAILRPIKPIDPFPEIVIGYIIKDKPTLDWDVFKTYDIPDSNQYVEYDTYTYTFKKFDKLENATAYWTDFLQDKTVIDNSIKRLEQKKSNKIWDFYSYNIDNSYISKLYDEMYMSFTNVRRFNEISQNIIKSFDQYTEKTDLISFEFEGLSEFETNIIETSGSADVTKGKLNIRVKHKKLKNIDYYVTATNGVHVDYDGTIYFANNNVSYVTAYLSADPSICKTVAVKPSQLVKIPGEKDLINSNEIHACLKSYNAHRVLRPLTVNSPVMFNETYHESIILHGNWDLMDDFGHSDDYYCKIEFNVGGEYKLCTKAEPIIRTSEFNSIHIAYANRMYIHGDVSVIDDTHLRLNLTALDLTARQFNSSESTYRITIFKYKRDKDNKKLLKETEDLVTFNAFLSCKSLFPTGALRPRYRLVNPLNLVSSGIENNKDDFSKSYKVAQNSIITITSRDSSSKLVSLSVEPANGNATSLVPKVKRNGDEYYIYCVGKGSYKINYSLYNESDNYIDDTDSYSIIISESSCSVNKDFDTLTDSNLYIKPFIENDKAGLKCELNIKDKIIPASIIAQFNTYDDAARTRGNNFASELDIKYIYTNYDYSNIDSGKLNFTIWYENSGFKSVAPLRIYLINVDNSIIYKDYTSESNTKSRIVSRAFMFFGLIDDFTDYGKDLNQELYAISKQNKISGFIKVSLGLSDKPWTSSLKIKEPVRPIYDPFITNLQNKFIAKFTPTQVSYINRIRKTIQNTSLQTTRINDYLKSQNLTISNPTSSVLLNNKLSYLSEIDSKKQISDSSIFDTAALGLSIIGEDNDTLSPWNVSPQITIDNPTVYYDLNEYYGKVRRGCMYKTTEKNYDLNIGKSTKFDTDLDTVGITISISKTDQIKIEFSFEQIYAMIDGNKEDIYCIDKNSLKIAGTIDGKRVELKYVNGCSWNKTTGKVIISEDKSFNLVFGVLNSRKRINLTFVIDEYYQILDDIVIEDYDTCCTNGKPLSESPLFNLGGVKFNTTYTFLSSLNVDNIKSEISKDKYAYSHIWVDPNILSGYTIVTNLIDSSTKIKKPTIVSNEDAGISTASAEPKDLFFGSLSVRNNNLIFEKNYVYKPIANIELIQPPKLAFRYVSDENIKWLVEDARQLNLLEDHDYDICLNLGKVNDDNKDDQYTTNLETNTYNIRILCKNKLILIASNVNKFSSFTFNYKKNYDKYGFITALCIFDSNDDLVRTYMLNTSFFPYTKATIVLERIHQTPIYYYNDALSEYKENGDYDNLLPSFTFYKDKVNQKMLCNDVQSYCSTYMGLISAMPLRFKTNFDTLVNNMSISVLNNKVCAIQHKDNNIHSYSYILGKTLLGSGIKQDIKITNYLELSGKNISIDDKSNEKEIISKQIPDTIKYIGYMMYYYNMLYLRNLGWEMNDDCDSEDMIYYMIMLDKLKHKDKIFSAFRKNLFNDNGKAIYGNQIDIYDSNFANKLDWKTTIGYIEYFNKFKNNILKYWEDRIDAYNILEEVLGEYDSKLTVTEQIDKYLDILGDDGTKRKKIYFILTTETGEDKWAVSQINNRIYQQDAFYYIWSNVYQIMFDGVFDFDLINDAIIKDIYNFGLYPEIEIPEMTDEGLFVPYRINRNGKIEESFEIKNNKKEYVWDGSEDEKYKYILDENNFIIGINADIDLTESEQNVRYWEFSQLSDFNGWGSYEIDGADGKGWGKLSKDGKEYVLTIKGKIVERTKRKNYLPVYHQKENSEKNGKRYTTYRRRLDSKAPQTVHTTYFGDCKEYWLDENKCNIIKTNKRSLITGIRLQRFLCELFISELNKTTYMVDVIQKFFEINNALGRLREDWRNILNVKNKYLTPFDKEIKYPLVDFNLKEFKFERKCIYPEDRTLRGALSYTFDYYCWDDHKIKSEEGSDELNIDIPEYSIQRQIIHESQIYDDYFTLSITVPQNTGIYRKGIGKSFTYLLEDNDKKYLSYISFVTDQKHTTQISLTQLNIGEDNKNSYYNPIYGVEVIPDESTGIEPFIIYPWNINRNTSLTIDNDDNNLTTYSNLYDSAIWSSSITDLSGLPNFDDYDRLSRYIDIDSSGLRNSEVIMSRIKSGELKDAPATELCYNYDAYEFIKSDKHNSISKTQLQTYTYTVKYFKGFEYSPKFSYYSAFAYNKITDQKLEVNYISNSEAKKYPLCEYEIKDNFVTYTYKYVLPNISYRLTYSYNTNAYQTIYSYYDKFHIKYKEEKHLGTAKPPIYELPGEKSISELSVSNAGISAMSLDAGISVTSEVPFENKNERLYLTVNRLDELMLHDNTFINNKNRINKPETKIIATVEPREIESDKFITIPPIITRPVPTFRPTLIPTITIAPIPTATITPIKPTEKPTSTEEPTKNPPSIFKDEDILNIIDKSSIHQVTVNKPKESDIKYSYYIKNVETINRKVFSDYRLKKYIGSDCDDIGDAIIQDYINELIMKNGFNEIVIGVTYYNEKNFIEFIINNDVEVIDKDKQLKDDLRKYVGFYLGSVSQWQIIQDNVIRINAVLKKIDDELHKTGSSYYPKVDYFYEGRYVDNRYDNRLFWTSSEKDKDEAWPMFFDRYYCGLNNKLTSAYVRPFMTYKDSKSSKIISVETKKDGE